MPVGGDGPAMKLAVNSLMTSSLRSISAHTATNGPAYSRLIGRIWERETTLQNTLTPVLEIAGAHFRERAAETDLTPEQRQARSRNLSILLREPINDLLEPDEVAIVGCALYAQSPVTGQPVLVDLIRHFAATWEHDRLSTAAVAFFTDYLSLLVDGVVLLMTRYGIGLECHLQNVVPVFVDGCPVRMLIRDWGGLKVYEPRLSRQGLAVETLPGSITVTSHLADLHDKVSYTLLQNHLAEIILILDQQDLVPETWAWRLVRERLEGAFATLAATDGVAAADVAADRAAFLAPHMPYKALTRMRLTPHQPGYRTVLVPSPVADRRR
jgi:siderophore synthetase component